MTSSLQSASTQNARRLTMLTRLWISLLIGIVVGLGVALVSPGSLSAGWLAAGLLGSISVFCLVSAWQWAGGGRLLAWMVALAFFLRLLTGVGLSLALPVWGYAEDCQKAGYLFKDACARDQEAFSIAKTGQGLYWFSGIKLDQDQYGGLAFLSGWVYRYLSPDAHRPFLIIILGAAFAAFGVPFLYQAVRLRWSERVAALTAWIFVLYPDAIFFGASQMREPFLLGLSAVAFWALLSRDQNFPRSMRRSLLVFSLAAAGMLFFSYRVALIIIGMLVIWFWLEFTAGRIGRRWQMLGWLGFLTGALVMAVFTWGWFRSSSGYDVLVTLKNSGQARLQFGAFGEQWFVPAVTVYGFAQPVLPAAISDADSLPLARGIASVRALGWYAMAPFLVYGFFTVLREPDTRRRRILIWLALAIMFWLVIAALRGGGDATDNPRYRSLFLPWLALLTAWTIDWAARHHDAWLWRWIVVEGIFLAFFTHWYLARNFKLWLKLPFWQMVFLILLFSAVVLVGGWVWDRLKLRGRASGEKDAFPTK